MERNGRAQAWSPDFCTPSVLVGSLGLLEQKRSAREEIKATPGLSSVGERGSRSLGSATPRAPSALLQSLLAI